MAALPGPNTAGRLLLHVPLDPRTLKAVAAQRPQQVITHICCDDIMLLIFLLIFVMILVMVVTHAPSRWWQHSAHSR